MNGIQNRSASILIILITCLIFIPLTSCHKEGPAYVGTWQFSEQINSDGLVLNTLRTITLTKRTYEETYRVQRENSAIISEIIGTSGDLSMTHSNMLFTLRKLGICIRDELDICTGNIEWHGDGSQYWRDNIIYFRTEIPGNYEVGEMTLWLTRDLNNDGDTDDAGEDVLFERV